MSEKTKEAIAALVDTAMEMARTCGFGIELSARDGLIEATDSSQLIALVVRRLRTEKDMAQKELTTALARRSPNTVINRESDKHR